MSDQEITCSDCGDVFVFTAAEQAFYAEKGLASPPKRCKACRQARKASARNQGGFQAQGRGQGHGQGQSNRRPRFTNDANEYRSPMQMNDDRYGAPRFGGRNDRGGPPRGNDRQPRPQHQVPRSGGGGDHQPPRSGGGGDHQPPRSGGGGEWGRDRGGFGSQGYGANEYRSPAFPERREPGRFGGNEARQNDRQSDGSDHRPPPRPRAEPRAPKARPPETQTRPVKPHYDITCAECGVAAQVPFKPIEGRQVFCQPCYRARRGTQSGAPSEALEVTGSDSGIVE